MTTPDLPLTVTPSSYIEPGVDDFIIAEDAALKRYLSTVTVDDQTQFQRPVQVWFEMPDPEIRQVEYPFLLINLLSIDEAKDRVMNRYAELDQPHEGIPLSDSNFSVRTWYPTPMELTYQITSWSRNPRHDRQILSKLNHFQLHPRFAQLPVNDAPVAVNTDTSVSATMPLMLVPPTARRLTVTGFAKRDTTDENKKRLFRNIWTIRIASEIFYFQVDQTQRATSVTINATGAPRVSEISGQVFYP